MIPGSSPVASVPVGGATATVGGGAGTIISSNVLDKSTKETYWLLEFYFDDTASLLLTNNNETLTGPNGTYQSAPDVDIVLPAWTGLFEEDPLKIQVPKSVAPLFEQLSTDAPHSPVDLSLYELSFDGDYYRTQLRFKGFLDKSSFALMGASGVLELEFITIKEIMDVPLSIVATDQCQNIFGQGGCRAIVQEEAITASSIIGTRVIHIGLLLPQTNGYFIRGFVERNGLRILVRDWDGSNVFDLARQPPQEWLGQSLRLVGGCNKSIDACRDAQRDREVDFLGLGVAMPDHNPITENS